MNGALYDFLGNWGWLILGGVLLAIELVATMLILVWFAIAAIIVGVIDLVFDPGWQVEVLLFAVLSIISTILGRKYFRKPKPQSDGLHDRGSSMIGRIFTLPAPLENGSGYVLVGDSRWRVLGPDLPQGARVVVTGLSGAALEVAPAPQTADQSL